MVTLKSLDTFWRHSDCGVALKIHVADAVIRSKLLDGTESAQLTPATAKIIHTLQLQVQRKILRLDTTYINRESTNEKYFRLRMKRWKKKAEERR